MATRPLPAERRSVRPSAVRSDHGEAAERGRTATDPREVPARGWREIALRVKDEAKADNVALLAAGVAFYALLSLVPAMVALVSIYGLVAEPDEVRDQVDDLLAAAPAEVRDLVGQQLEGVTTSSPGGLSLAVGAGLLVALWSASSGMKHLMSAVNVAYDETETRGFVRLRGTALALTVGAVAFVAVALGAIAVVPAVVEDTALGDPARWAITILRWPVLGLGLLVGLAVLYRLAPDREDARWVWTGPGSVFAVVAWLIASGLFSLYTSNLGSYGETYGSLGAVVVLMLWLMISAAVVILGAEINAEAERQTVADSTDGQPLPLGERGAVAADTVAAGEPGASSEASVR